MTLKNTDNEYRITVRNTQTIDGKKDTIEEQYYGSLFEKNKKQYILYKTKDDGGGYSTMIKLDKDAVVIKRSGSINSSMKYRAGEKNRFLYEIPYGSIEMEVDTERVIALIDENGGSIELQYVLTAQGEQYFNNMKITVDKR